MKYVLIIFICAISTLNCKSQVDMINVRFEIKNERKKTSLSNAGLKIFNSDNEIQLSRIKEDSLPIIVKLVKGEHYRLQASAKCHLVKKINLKIPNEIYEDEYAVIIDLERFTHCPSITLYQSFDINYNKNEYKLSETDESILDSLGFLISNNPEIELHINGHTDHQEDSQIADNRILIVKEYLLKIDVKKTQIKTKNMGANKPLISLYEINNLGSEEEKKAAFQLNRRVSFGIYHLDEKLK